MPIAAQFRSNLPGIGEADQGWNPLRFLAMCMGAAWSGPPGGARGRRRFDKFAFFAQGDEMLRRAQRRNEPLTVFVLALNDLPELERVFGSGFSKEVVASVRTKLRRIAGTKGLAARTDPTVFTMFLPKVGEEAALAAADAVLGQPACIEIDHEGEEIVLLPEIKVQAVCAETHCIRDVYIAARRELVQAQLEDQRRKKYLERERESHSRHPESQPSPFLAKPYPAYAPMVATMPVPMRTLAVPLGGRSCS